MRKVTLFAVIAVLVAVAGGLVFLATWDIRPPSTVVEKDVPDERLPK